MPELPQQSATSPAPAAPAAPEPKVPQSSIAAELSRVYDAAEAKAAEKPADKEARGTAITAGQGNVAPEAKTRGEDGRFASTKPADKPDAKDAKPDAKPAADSKAPAKDAKAEDAAKAPDAKAVAEAADKAKSDIKPHPRWKPEVQEKFTKLAAADPELAKFVLERQGETEKVVTQATQAAKHGEKFKALDDVLAAGRQQRSMQGVDDPMFLRSLVAASDFLAKEPEKGIRMLAEQYGVDLKQVAEGKSDEVQDSPTVRALQKQVGELTNYINSINQGAQKQRMSGAFQSIEAFKQERDEQGQPRYPYFDDVVDDVTTVVARQIEAGQQPNLKAAYEKAIRLNDGVWTKLQAAKSDAERKQREEEEVQRVRDAKLAGFSVSGSGGGGNEVAGSIRDELRRQVEKSYR